MSSISGNRSCSGKCKQSGRCTCLIQYDDGSIVPGSGQSDNPYVVERPKIQCILDAQGRQLVPDVNRCVTLPNYVRAVDSDGTIYLPDSDGIITLPTEGLTEFTLKDAQGNSYVVNDGDTILFEMDGGESSGFTVNNINEPLIQGNTVILPQLKNNYYSGYNLADRLTGGSVPIPNPGTSLTLANIDFSRPKTTNFALTVNIRLMEAASNINPTLSEFVTFNVDLNRNAGLFIPATTEVFQDFVWAPDFAFGYKSYSASFDIVGQNAEATSAAELTLTTITDTLLAARAVFLEYEVSVSWV